MRQAEPRIAPLERGWDPELDRIISADSPNIMRTLAHHPKLAKRWTVFANHLLMKSSLPARDREILILRVGWLCQSHYEFGQHTLIAKRDGLTDEEIARIVDGADADGWSDFERALIRLADELHEDACVSDETWTDLAARYDTQQMMDAVFTVGQYHLVSMALNSFRVPLDAGVPGFPS